APAVNLLARVRRRWRLFRLRGDAVECPCCGGSFREFMPGRDPNNPICPRCGAQARHRALWLYLHERTDLFSGKGLRVLHFAPERALGRALASASGIDYVSADLPDRLREAGFEVTVDKWVRGLPPDTVQRYGLFPLEDMYVCRKG